MNGSTSFFNFDNDLISGNPILKSPLGTGKNIRGKTLRVSTTFGDDNPAAKFVSVIYTISNDIGIVQQESRFSPKGDANFFTFRVKIIFE